ncbi:DUF4403 family protein [Flavobacterium sp.]|uniref:DUF4403 family protein n=1 Tax=Flavobacterium sp. TaxID=239 RepID=UPI003527FF7F
MKWFVFFIAFILLSVFFISCSSTKNIEALKPTPSDGTPVVYQNKTSFIGLPVEITLKDIEKQLNKNLQGLIYNDSILDDDATEMKIWKSGTIVLSEKNDEIVSEIPLKIWAKVKYGTDFLGLNDTKEIFMDGVITLSSKVNLTNWKLYTVSRLTDYKWNQSPSILVAGKVVPITYLVNPTLSLFKKSIAKQIDKAIDETCDFKPYVLNALAEVSKPFLTHYEYETWFKLIPIEIYATAAVLQNEKITMDMGLKCTMQTMVGQEPKNSFDKSKIILKPVTRIPNKAVVAIAAVSTYKSASRVVTKNFKGQEFGSGSKKVSVQNVELWEKEGKLIIALDLQGSVNGTIYLTGYPQYNTTTKEIYFDDLNYVLNTKNVLLKSANWLLQGTVLKTIQENCRYSIAENLAEGKSSFEEYLDNYSPMKGVYVNGTINDIVFEKMEITNKAIIAFIETSGEISVKIDGID